MNRNKGTINVPLPSELPGTTARFFLQCLLSILAPKIQICLKVAHFDFVFFIDEKTWKNMHNER